MAVLCRVPSRSVPPAGRWAGARGADVRGSSDFSSAGRGLELAGKTRGVPAGPAWLGAGSSLALGGRGASHPADLGAGPSPKPPVPERQASPAGAWVWDSGGFLGRPSFTPILEPMGSLGVGRRPCEAVISLGNKALFLPTGSEGARVARGGALCEVGPPWS